MKEPKLKTVYVCSNCGETDIFRELRFNFSFFIRKLI